MKLLIIFIFSTIQLCSYSMEEYITNHDDLSSFDYKEYLKSTSFTDITQLNKDRNVAQKKKLGDSFLYQLTDFYLATHPLNMDNLNDRISIGEKYLDYDKKNSKINTIYSYLGYYILTTSSHLLEKEIADNSSNWYFFIKNFFKLKKIKLQYVESKIYIKSKKHTAKKLLDKIRSGDFRYIWKRFYFKYIYIDIFKTTKKSKLRIKPFKVNRIVDKQIFNVFNNDEKIGEMIWLDRAKYKAHYLASGDIKAKYQDFLTSHKTKARVALTGGFINDYFFPEGLTIENGEVLNASLLPHRDGLVIIENNGKCHIVNLQKGSFYLPNKEKINLLVSTSGYVKLLNWSINNQGSFFQTQLLAYDDKLLFNTNENSKQINYLRERRLLAVVNNEKEDKFFHIIVNIRKSVSLELITNKIFKIMQEKKYHIEAILNLDVGSYDIMNVYDTNGSMILTSPRQIKNAKNLLFYTQ